MPEKVDTGGFPLKHHPLDLSGGRGGYDSSSQNFWDFSVGDFIQNFPPGPPTENLPETPHNGEVAYDDGSDTFYYWDEDINEWVAIIIPDETGPDVGGAGLFIGEVAWSPVSLDLYMWNGTAWVLFMDDLPTADPGGGHMWLSPS